MCLFVAQSHFQFCRIHRSFACSWLHRLQSTSRWFSKGISSDSTLICMVFASSILINSQMIQQGGNLVCIAGCPTKRAMPRLIWSLINSTYLHRFSISIVVWHAAKPKTASSNIENIGESTLTYHMVDHLTSFHFMFLPSGCSKVCAFMHPDLW